MTTKITISREKNQGTLFARRPPASSLAQIRHCSPVQFYLFPFTYDIDKKYYASFRPAQIQNTHNIISGRSFSTSL